MSSVPGFLGRDVSDHAVWTCTVEPKPNPEGCHDNHTVAPNVAALILEARNNFCTRFQSQLVWSRVEERQGRTDGRMRGLRAWRRFGGGDAI